MLQSLILAAILASEPEVKPPTLLNTTECGPGCLATMQRVMELEALAASIPRVLDRMEEDKQGHHTEPEQESQPAEPGTLKESGELDESFSNPPIPKTANQQIRHLTDTAFVYSLVLGGDLISTQVCFNRNPRCEEKNPLMFNSDAALAAKIMIVGAAVFVDYRLYTGSHPRGASWLRRIVVVAGIGIIASNFVTAFQK